MKIVEIILLCIYLLIPSIDADANTLIQENLIELPSLNWIDKDGAQIPSIKLEDLKGKVVYLHFFQSWCPGCLTDGLPAISSLSKKYAKNKNVKFLAIQTVFEGFQTNSKEKLKTIRKRFDLQFPMAHDDGGGKGSEVMKTFKTRGTPWMIIMDLNGKVLVSKFHQPVSKSIIMIDELLYKNRKNLRNAQRDRKSIQEKK